MEGYRPELSFGEDVAATYDDGPRGDEAECVAFLGQRAGGGPVLELAIGTGRIALPLAERGLRVDGIELSQPMIDRLRAKPGGAQLEVVRGDLADVAVPGRYQLVYVVWNTLFNLLSQAEQTRCFRNVAEHLTNDGVFVVEGFVPWKLPRTAHVDVDSLALDSVGVGVWQHDPVRQVLEGNHVLLTGEGARFNPIVQRYAWPAELDLMAQLAGLRLTERWAGWAGEPFTGGSENCVSCYRR